VDFPCASATTGGGVGYPRMWVTTGGGGGLPARRRRRPAVRFFVRHFLIFGAFLQGSKTSFFLQTKNHRMDETDCDERKIMNILIS
jgi:hypothetical protein